MFVERLKAVVTVVIGLRAALANRLASWKHAPHLVYDTLTLFLSEMDRNEYNIIGWVNINTKLFQMVFIPSLE